MSRVNAIIIYLIKENTVKIKESLKYLHKFFNAKFGYPILIFHEQINETDQHSLSEIAQLPITFIKVPSFDQFPKNFFLSHTQIQKWCEGKDGGRKAPLGYRQMCRFFSYEIYTHPAMESYDYYWRFDDDSFLCAPLNYDPFQHMEENKLIYGYRTIEFENPREIMGLNELWQATRTFAKSHRLSRHYLKKLCANWKGNYTGFNFYNNFEINKVSFWKENAIYKDYFDYLDREELGFFKYRWGDANVRALSIGLFLKPKQVHHFQDIAYRHNDHYAIPFSDRIVYSKDKNPFA